MVSRRRVGEREVEAGTALFSLEGLERLVGLEDVVEAQEVDGHGGGDQEVEEEELVVVTEVAVVFLVLVNPKQSVHLGQGQYLHLAM